MNKIRINNIFLVLLFVLFTLSNITYADERKDEWQNKEYDKENIKRILIKPVIISDGIKLEYFDEMRIREYCEQIKNNKKINEIGVKLLSEDDLLGKISGVVNEDLKEVAKRLLKCIRSNDYAFRIGGDEFMLILNGNLDAQICKKRIERIKKLFQ